jgi:ankyrin repeat protein
MKQITRMSKNPLYNLGKLTPSGGREFTLKGSKPNTKLSNPFFGLQPVAELPATQEPATQEPATQEPVTEAPVTEVPVTTRNLPTQVRPQAQSTPGGYVMVNPLSPFSKTERKPTAPGLEESAATYTEVNITALPEVNPETNVNGIDEKEKELFKCIKAKDIKGILNLLRQGVNINTTNFANTPLIYAILATNSLDVITTLIINGADVKQRGYNNITPLIAVCSTTSAQGNYFMKNIFDLLMDYITANYEGQEQKDIINYQPIYQNNTREGMNALMMACHHGFDYIVDRLIAAGANVDLLEENVNESALYIAVYEAILNKSENYKTIIESLVRAGADCSKGKNPLTLPVTPDLKGLLSACEKKSAGGLSRKYRKSHRASRKSRRATRKNKNRKTRK